MVEINTKAGTLSAETYEDGCAQGINIFMNGILIVAVDVLSDNGEVRCLTYQSDEEEPDFATIITKGE